jgi:hypothetical protein
MLLQRRAFVTMAAAAGAASPRHQEVGFGIAGDVVEEKIGEARWSRYSVCDEPRLKHEPGLAAGHVGEGEGGAEMAAPGTVESGAWLAPCFIVHKSYRI